MIGLSSASFIRESLYRVIEGSTSERQGENPSDDRIFSAFLKGCASIARYVSKDERIKLGITFDTEWWGRSNLLEGVPFHDGIARDTEAAYEALDLLTEFGARATFFVVSDDAPPKLLSEILKQGSEVASHSKTHPLFYQAPVEEWRHQVADSKRDLEDKSGAAVRGFRAPSWSVPFEKKDYFLDLLREEGYRYDSSFCSFKTSLYGDPRFPKSPQVIGDDFVEIPLPRIGFPNWPWVGGFYFRVIPNFLLTGYVKRDRPAFLYFHPWELYPERKKLKLSLVDHLITYYGRRRNKNKLRRLFGNLQSTFRFVPLGEVADELLAAER